MLATMLIAKHKRCLGRLYSYRWLAWQESIDLIRVMVFTAIVPPAASNAVTF